MRRQCEFCDRFWRAVASYVAPMLGLTLAGLVGLAGWVIALYWVSKR